MGNIWGKVCTSSLNSRITNILYSAAGKTQLALQLSLCIQLPRSMGGLEGSACYLTTSSTLPTARLHQISRTRNIFSGDVCGLAHVHTISTPTISVLINVLINILPSFISSQASNSSMKPVRILVIDALAELFHSSPQTSSSTLFERSKNISEISLLLHNIATAYHIAVIVLNEVVDAFDHANNSEAMEGYDYLVYNDQSKWFNKADSVPGENLKEASLGLTWSNQINTRILLSRTGRRRHLDDNELAPRKRLRIDYQHTEEQSKEADQLDDEPALIRRLSVVFSSISEPISMDYIVSEQGITCLSGTGGHPHQHSSVPEPSTLPPVDICETPNVDPFSSTTAAPIEEEWDRLSFDEGAYDDFDWDALEQQLTQIPA
ncbi:hypothetical protein BDQ12DRAFT_299919 [Crucibulum laeve]|uniref:Rad51-like C-terminal domain-containing protein n=1 Tax=Crucibulum laeve TaxID=68775 RepID=A0A5C3MDU2_9AGAR|nr:hypothetical protein BDQ12DRAFT_299919 [Crucibulum laeve]